MAQKFTLVYVIHYGMLTVHMPFLRNVAALLKICFKNLEGIITSENIMIHEDQSVSIWLVYVG